MSRFSELTNKIRKFGLTMKHSAIFKRSAAEVGEDISMHDDDPNTSYTPNDPAPIPNPDGDPSTNAYEDPAAQTMEQAAPLPVEEPSEPVADRDEKVRIRAYEIWEEEGQPEGRETAHWFRAQAEID